MVTVFRKEPTSTIAGFHAGPLSWYIELEFGDIGFSGGRKTGEPGRNPQSIRREPTTNSTHICMAPGRKLLGVSTLKPGPSVI